MNGKVKELRKALGLTLEKFGEKLGVGKNAISRIETGKSNLTDQMLKAICNVNWDGKHVNEEWFYGNSEEMFKSDPGSELKALAEKYQMSDMEYAFLEEFFKLDPSRREDFFKTLDKVFSAVHASSDAEKPKAKRQPSAELNLEKMSNEELGKLVRKEMQLEEKAGEKSEVS